MKSAAASQPSRSAASSARVRAAHRERRFTEHARERRAETRPVDRAVDPHAAAAHGDPLRVVELVVRERRDDLRDPGFERERRGADPAVMHERAAARQQRAHRHEAAHEQAVTVRRRIVRRQQDPRAPVARSATATARAYAA